MKAKKSRPARAVPARTAQEGEFLDWVTDSNQFTIEAALALYRPGNTVPLTAAERAALDSVDLVPLLRSGVEIGLAAYHDRNAILKSLDDAMDAAEGSPGTKNRGKDAK